MLGKGRALRDRGADLKRKSAAITGNMISMVTDAKAFTPYLPQVDLTRSCTAYLTNSFVIVGLDLFII